MYHQGLHVQLYMFNVSYYQMFLKPTSEHVCFPASFIASGGEDTKNLVYFLLYWRNGVMTRRQYSHSSAKLKPLVQDNLAGLTTRWNVTM